MVQHAKYSVLNSFEEFWLSLLIRFRRLRKRGQERPKTGLREKGNKSLRREREAARELFYI